MNKLELREVGYSLAESEISFEMVHLVVAVSGCRGSTQRRDMSIRVPEAYYINRPAPYMDPSSWQTFVNTTSNFICTPIGRTVMAAIRDSDYPTIRYRADMRNDYLGALNESTES